MIITIDNQRCILCGVCEGLAPKLFQQTNLVTVSNAEVNRDLARAYLCYEACPTEAIKLEE